MERTSALVIGAGRTLSLRSPSVDTEGSARSRPGTGSWGSSSEGRSRRASYQYLISAAMMIMKPATTQIVAGDANSRIHSAPPAIAMTIWVMVEVVQPAISRPAMPFVRPCGTAWCGPAQVLKVSI